MKILSTFLFWLLLAGIAAAQALPPVQTINTNLGIPCNGTGSSGAVTFCKPGWTYGCTVGAGSTQILGTDGNRTSILFQNTTAAGPITLTFGDSSIPSNGFVVQPGTPFLWANMAQGNIPGRVASTAISISGALGNSCVFMFTN